LLGEKQEKARQRSLMLLSLKKILESFYGWNAYAKWANSYKLISKISRKISCVKQ